MKSILRQTLHYHVPPRRQVEGEAETEIGVLDTSGPFRWHWDAFSRAAAVAASAANVRDTETWAKHRMLAAAHLLLPPVEAPVLSELEEIEVGLGWRRSSSACASCGEHRLSHCLYCLHCCPHTLRFRTS